MVGWSEKQRKSDGIGPEAGVFIQKFCKPLRKYKIIINRKQILTEK